MKTIKLLFATVLFLNSLLFSQDALKQGVYTLGGSISFSSTKQSSSNFLRSEVSSTTTNFSVSPSFSYFVINNLLIGGGVSFNYLEMKNEFSSGLFGSVSRIIQKRFSIGPSVRYYFSGGSVIPFLGVSDRYSTIIDSDQNGNTFLAEGGINYFLSRSVALEPFLSYSINSLSSPDFDTKTFSVGIRIGYFIVK